MSLDRFDVAVVGLGALGSSAAYHAAVKGAKVVGFEQFELGHVNGSSHDTSRIVRTSNQFPEYVSLARSAYKDWAVLEKRVGHKLLTITGGLVFFPRDGPNNHKDFTTSLDKYQVPYELLSSEQVNRRWPQFKIRDNVDVVYTADSGVCHAAKTVTAMQYVARAYGASLKENTRVDRIVPDKVGLGATVETSRGSFHADKVIIAADAWTNKLLEPLGAKVPITVMQEQVTYFKPKDASIFDTDRFPVWMWGGEKWFYGFPAFGEPTIKAARDTSENYMTPENRTFVHSPQLEDELASFMDTIIPTKGEPLRTITCQYTITPNRQFIIAPLDKHAGIFVALGAAHAFKFAPAIGRVLAEMAIDGKTTDDVSKFGIPREPAGGFKFELPKTKSVVTSKL